MESKKPPLEIQVVSLLPKGKTMPAIFKDLSEMGIIGAPEWREGFMNRDLILLGSFADTVKTSRGEYRKTSDEAKSFEESDTYIQKTGFLGLIGNPVRIANYRLIE